MINNISQADKLNVMLVVNNAAQNPAYQTLTSKREIKQVWVCEKISDALLRLHDAYIDLMIVDFYLIDGTVLELLQEITDILDKQKTAILVLVPENVYALSLLAYRKGADCVIVKDNENHYLVQLYDYVKKRYAQSLVMNPHLDMSHGIIGLDRNLNINFLNAAALGYLEKKEVHSLIGQPVMPLFDAINPVMVVSVRNSIKIAKTTGQPQPIGTFKFSEIQHALASVDLMVFPLLGMGSDISGFILNLREHVIPSLEKAKSYEYDSLTGLLHRTPFFYRLEKTLFSCKKYRKKGALLHIDIDDFKTLNEALGHRLADELLKKIAMRLQLHIKEIDLLARVGADEFMLFLPHLQLMQEAQDVAKTLLNAMKAFFLIDNQSYFVSLCIGISLYPQDADGVEPLVKAAHKALSAAKDKGRNQYQFYKKEVDMSVSSDVFLVNELYQALENNELDLYLQPQVCAQGHDLIGFEALIRWQHPKQGLLLPVHFIPIAEQTGLINEVGRWVFYQVCEYINLLESNGYQDLVIAVNVSVQQFMQDDFVNMLQNILSSFHVMPHHIELEITETIFLQGKEGVIDKLNQLKLLGFKIVMDDFGTGYSSLSYLKTLPLDGIKIDRTFIAELSHSDQAIVAAIITLAKKMNFKTLAEGVETSTQAELLNTLGCDYLQGYLFSKALPITEVLSFLKKKGKKDDLSNAI